MSRGSQWPSLSVVFIHYPTLLSVFISFFLHAVVTLDITDCGNEIGVCDTNADCIYRDGIFVCTCKNGYTGDGFLCAGKVIIQFEYSTQKSRKNARMVCYSTPGNFRGPNLIS